MIDPENARTVLREYNATTTGRQLVEDTRRYSPELAERLDLTDSVARGRIDARRAIRGWFASFGRSVHKLFS